jgi:hypothetical protein
MGAEFDEIPVIFPFYREFVLETGSPMTAHTTIQSSQTIETVTETKYPAFAGIFAELVAGFWSPWRLSAEEACFWATGLRASKFRSWEPAVQPQFWSFGVTNLSADCVVLFLLHRLLRIESERLELAAPFGRRIAQAFDADAAREAPLDGGSHQIRCQKREREGHVDLADTATFAGRDLLDISD